MKLGDLCHNRHEVAFVEGASGNEAASAIALQKLLWLQQRRLAKSSSDRRKRYKQYLKEAEDEGDQVKVLDMLDVLYEQAVSESKSVASLAASQVKVLRAGVEITPMADTNAHFTVAPGLEEALAAHPAHALPIDEDMARELGIDLDDDGRPVYGLTQ